ncbi:hypothetical protein GCM10010423_65230 [Streptomyces levis]|uniref:Uncharacterized protein n=1 Tax=Streptomyces levis TaxID=285566 RepID=A0ABN3P2J8_9ACTN
MPDYTYSGDPSSSPKDAVRFLAQATGTDPETGFITDEEIEWILSQESNIYLAAARVADRVSTIFGGKQSKTVGPLSIDYRNQASSYRDLAARLRAQANSTTKAVGPISTGAMTALFQIGMTDYPGGVAPWNELAPWNPQ